jgi:enoyl-CoA hydratase/carnithine racemase
MTCETLLVDATESVLTVTLNRPERKNAINPVMWEELRSVFVRCEADDDIRVMVVTGAGGDFCSGADVSVPRSSRHPLAEMRKVCDVAMALHMISKPTIAKVRGVAVGAGANLAFGCDLVVAAAGARLSEIFTQRALSVDFGGSWLLPRMVGLHRAKELAFFGDIFTAEQAAEYQMINRVVADDELDAFVAGWARRLAEGPRIAQSLNKRMLNESYAHSMSQALELEAVSQINNLATADTREAAAAWVARRLPSYTGQSILTRDQGS